MKRKTERLISLMNLAFWVIFIGSMVNAGGLLVSLGISLVKPETAANMYPGKDWSSVLDFGVFHMIRLMVWMAIIESCQAYIAFLVTRALAITDFKRPFNERVAMLVRRISLVALAAGVLSIGGEAYSSWLADQGVQVYVHWAGVEWLFLSGVLFTLTLIYQRGIELQHENELTI